MDTLYHDLGIEPDADQPAVESAYRKAAKKHHPDRPGGDRAAFEKVNRAAMILRDPQRRARYDRDGTTDTEPDNAMSMIAAMMGKAIETALTKVQGQFELYDLVELMIADTQEQVAHLKSEVRKGRDAVARTDKMIARIRFKGEGVNLFERILRDRRGSIVDQVANLERSREGFEQLLMILADYGWDTDKPEQLDIEALIGRGGSVGDRYRRAMDAFDR